jgi:hypothetical protein
MSEKCELLVESVNDQYVVFHLLKKHGISDDFKITSKDGIDNVFKALRIQLKFQDDEKLERIGIVIDANADLEKRWSELRKILGGAGYMNLPDMPSPTGTIIRQDGLPVFGVWLMPNNTIAGILENFIAFLIPEKDTLWQLAYTTVSGLSEKRFASKDEIKAQIHTWLAWQKDPGTPMGWSITKGYLNANAPMAHKFIDWLKTLFV